MTTLSTPPYFHPTTVAFVDDNLDFLSNLSLQLDTDLAYRLFDSPTAALSQLNSVTRSRPLSERFFAALKCNSQDMPAEPVLRLDLAAIQREVGNTQRFAEVAVVLVDYAMPEMDGIEFCRQINNPHIQKVLFTGVADESVAISAFNEGLIDRFIRKSERSIYDQINITIRELQRAYILTTSQTINHVLSLHNPDYLDDAVFTRFFDQLLDEHQFVEYYMSIAPRGFLLLDADGQATRLIVLSDDEFELHERIARSHGAPQALLGALSEREAIPHFAATSDGFFRPQCSDWSACLHPAQVLEGRNRYYWALAPDEKTTAENEIASYNSYLNWLDTTGYALI